MRDQLFYHLIALREKLKNLSLYQSLRISFLLLFVISLPFSLYVAQQQQEIRQRAEEVNKVPVPDIPQNLTPTPIPQRAAY